MSSALSFPSYRIVDRGDHKTSVSNKKSPVDVLFSDWGRVPPPIVVAANVTKITDAKLIICLMDDSDEEKYLKFYGDVFQRYAKEKPLNNFKPDEGIVIFEDYADHGYSAIDRTPLKYFPPLEFNHVGWLSPEVSKLIRWTIKLIAITMEALAVLRVLDLTSKKNFGVQIKFIYASSHLASLPPVAQKTTSFVEIAKASKATSLDEMMLHSRKTAAPLRAYKRMQNLRPYKLRDHAALLSQAGQRWIEQNKEKLLTTVFPENQRSLIATLEKYKDKKIMITFMGFQHGNPNKTAYPEEVQKLFASIHDIPHVIVAPF